MQPANIHRWPRVLIANISYRHARVVLLALERHGTGLGAALILEDASDGDDDRICAHVRIMRSDWARGRMSVFGV